MGRSGLRPYMSVLVPRDGDSLRALLVAAEGFGDDLLEWDVFFYGEFAAVVEFGGGVLDAAVDAAQLDANFAESCGDADMFARQNAALRGRGAHAEGCCFGEDECRESAGVLRFAQDGQQ